MASLATYFEEKAYKPKYTPGARISGLHNGIPFVGTVGNDRLLSELAGPEITVHLDLPMRIEDQFRHIIIAKHKQVKPLKELTLP
jgi:hypothetical protein